MSKNIVLEIVIAGVILVGAAVGIAFFQYRSTDAVEDVVHYHAGFQVYVDNKLQDYSGFEFMELQPCTPDEIDDDATVHLHNNVGDVVHVHHADMTWQNLVDYINDRHEGAINTTQKDIVGYVNGVKVDDIFASPIGVYDSAVIFIGSNSNMSTKLAHAVTVDHIKLAEASKENCGLDAQ